jgi:DNA-directed RNA polymerase specialized sigma24 family protein
VLELIDAVASQEAARYGVRKEDILGEVYLALIKAQLRLGPAPVDVGILARSAKNGTRDFLRSERRHTERYLASDPLVVTVDPSALETEEFLGYLLVGCSESSRLIWVEGLTWDEAAQRCNCHRDTVGSRLRKDRARVARRWAS